MLKKSPFILVTNRIPTAAIPAINAMIFIRKAGKLYKNTK
jgi:hypothetical protein